jgi:hypothetical protein
MAFRDWFAKRPDVLSSVRHPSPEYPTPLSAIEALLGANIRAGDDAAWITFQAGPDADPRIIEVSGDQINFCTREVQLDRLLAGVNESQLVASVHPGGRAGADRTCWTLEAPTAATLARIVHAVFRIEYALGDSYPLQGERNS